MPITAVDAISPAFQHTKRQLLQPFRFWQWTRLAIVGLLAGEMGSSGGSRFSRALREHQPQQHFGPGFPKIDPALLVPVIAVLAIAALTIFIVLLYISSVMRFILFDSVVAKECHIGDGWNRRQVPGWKYFLWHLAFAFVVFVIAVLLVGLPAAYAFRAGWFSQPHAHMGPLILGGIILVGAFVVFAIVAAIIQVFTKDFVVPQMALEGIDAVEGWRRLWPMIERESGAYIVYALMKIVLSIIAGIAVTIVSVILGVLVVIPAVVVGLAAVFTGKSAGMVWNPLTITAAIVAACVVIFVLLYLLALISVPVIVFFPAYSIYFFASRYRPLSLILYPPPAAGTPSAPPPLPPSPQPA